MKDRILTNTIRSIRRAFPRFLSLLVMSMLGVFAFSGLQATAPDMRATLDRYLDQYRLYDLRVISDLGLTDSDAAAFRALPGVEAAECGYSRDIAVSTRSGETVLRVYSVPEVLNAPELLRGRFPASADEIVVEENYLRDHGLSLGDVVPLGEEGFVCPEAVIVGTADTVLYFNNTELSQERGSTTLGTGTVDYYAYTLPECFDAEVYSCIYLTVSGAAAELTGSERYCALVENARSELEAIREERQNARYQTIFDEASGEIDDRERELNEVLGEAKAELDEAGAELDDALAELTEAETELSDAAEQLSQSRNELDEGWSACRTALADAQLTESGLDASIEELENSAGQLRAALAMLPEAAPQYAAVSALLQEAEAGAEQLKLLKNSLSRLYSGESEYASKQAEYEDGLAAYQESRERYADGLADYEAALADYEAAEAEGRSAIVDARAELSELKHPTIYFFDRRDDGTYSDYLDDADSVANLSKIFPAVFFAVAVLVSLISMNRMVEEERGEIGALKSLGFGNGRIMAKYLIFSLSATVVGGAAGAALGLTILPTMIFGIYGILFDLPDLSLSLNPVSTLVGFLITVLCVCGTSVYTAWRELRSKPSELLRPKAPKSGRRVFLERIRPVWKRMSFSQKVTVRNLFRYRKRVLVTVGGIMGCTALMLCGFGLRDSITDIATEQGDGIYLYDATVYVSEPDEDTERLFASDGITACYRTRLIAVAVDGIDVSLFVAEDAASLPKINRMPDVKTGEALQPVPGAVIITEKLSAMSGLQAGDTITVTDADNRAYRFPISGVAVNYVGHYVYVDAETFAAADGEAAPNVFYLMLDEAADRSELTKQLLSDEHVLSVGYKTDLMDNVNHMLSSLNSVVLILIVLAALLAFVVLYNLSNININERKREIATLKVLGFHDKEVDAYITKETAILTALGIVLGLAFGYFLTNAVVSTVEIESCRFIHRIKPVSYLCSAVFSALFTLIVNFITHFKLKRIDMIESLKSVE